MASVSRAAHWAVVGAGFAVVAALELAGLVRFLEGSTVLPAVAHLVAAALLAVLLPFSLPKTVDSPVVMALTLFVLAAALPGFGPIGFAVALPIAARFRRPPAAEPFRYIRPPPLPLRPLFQGEGAPLRFSEGALALVLKNAPDPDKRVSAVMALRRMAEARATPLLRIALKDKVDDVRLLAYALNDGIDQAINARIQRRLRKLSELPPAEQGRARKALAQDYWDLAFLGLASADVEAFVLSEAARHLEQVLESSPDGGAALLLGRVRLRQRRPAEADAAFERARGLGLPSVAVGPYRAEAAFLRRRFPELRARLAELPEGTRARLPLAAVRGFWLAEVESEKPASQPRTRPVEVPS